MALKTVSAFSLTLFQRNIWPPFTRRAELSGFSLVHLLANENASAYRLVVTLPPDQWENTVSRVGQPMGMHLLSYRWWTWRMANKKTPDLCLLSTNKTPGAFSLCGEACNKSGSRCCLIRQHTERRWFNVGWPKGWLKRKHCLSHWLENENAPALLLVMSIRPVNEKTGPSILLVQWKCT